MGDFKRERRAVAIHSWQWMILHWSLDSWTECEPTRLLTLRQTAPA
jgi:hypothetical protein